MVRLLSIALLFGLVAAAFGKRLPRNPPQPMECGLNPESGMCLAYMPSYYFHSDKMSCERFIYGGCGGNANRFPTKKACEDHCLYYERGTGNELCAFHPEQCYDKHQFRWYCVVGIVVAVGLLAAIVTAAIVVYKKYCKKRVQDVSPVATAKLAFHWVYSNPSGIFHGEKKPASAPENTENANPLPPPAYEEKVPLS